MTVIQILHNSCGQGFDFAWFPAEAIHKELDEGLLKPLPLREGGERFDDMYLTFADPDFPSRGTVRIAEIIREDIAQLCPQTP